MKKLLTLALLAAVGVASAASIDWRTATSRNTYVWDSDGEKFNGSAYLVLKSDMDDTILAPTETETFAQLLDANKLASVSLTDGKYAVDQSTVTSGKLTAGTEYEFQIVLVDSNGNYKTTPAVKERAYTSGTDDARIISFGTSDFGASKNPPSDPAGAWNDAPVYQNDDPGPGPGPDPSDVPEPATGALALAGVALLFKRRR